MGIMAGAVVSVTAKEDRRYARFYYPEFIRDYREVYADDAAFATWMRLLVIAEQMWPMPPELPRSVKPRPLRTLVDAGLVSVAGVTFCIKGHDAERSRRRESGRKGAGVRWDSDGNANASANAMRTHSDGNANAMPSTSTSKSKSKAEIPPPPAERGLRKDGTNPRANGSAPRQTGDAPRDHGQSPRQERQRAKRDMTPIHVILARSAANRTES